MPWACSARALLDCLALVCAKLCKGLQGGHHPLGCPPRAGPCLATHTACSSSLVAAHLAAAALERREAPAAAAAGVFLILLAGTMAGICQLQVRI
jgi:hypothetical protein